MGNPDSTLAGHGRVLALFRYALLSSALLSVTSVFKIYELHWRDGSKVTRVCSSVPNSHIRWLTTARNCKVLGFFTHPLEHLHSSDTHTMGRKTLKQK